MPPFRIFPALVAATLIAADLDGDPANAGPMPESGLTEAADIAIFQRAIDAHEQGVLKDEEAVLESISLFEDLLEENPDNPIILAFYGSACTLRARDAAVFRKPGWARKGFALIDRAVELAPDCPAVRSVRAVNAYRVPGFLGRGDIAREDFRVLVDWSRDKPERFDPALLRFVLFHAGLHALEEDRPEAVAHLERAHRTEGGSISDETVEEALRKARDRFPRKQDASS